MLFNQPQFSAKLFFRSKGCCLSLQSCVKTAVFLGVSAVLWHSSFFLPELFGFLILFVLFPLVPLFRQKSRFLLIFISGLIWGLFIFGIHFLWFLELLLSKSQAGIMMSFCLYGIVVGWFCLTAGIWFVTLLYVTKNIQSKSLLILVLYCSGFMYTYALEQYALLPMGRAEGYPFICPLIPLIEYPIVAQLVRCYGQYWYGTLSQKNQALKDIVLSNCTPQKLEQGKTPEQIIKRLILKIKSCNCAANPEKKFLFLASESSLPCVLAQQKTACDLLIQSIPANAQVIIGAWQKIGANTTQTLDDVHLGLIRNCYNKRHLILGVETNQTAWGKLSWIEQPFLKGQHGFVVGNKNCFDAKNLLFKTIQFVPIICSELFYMPIKTFINKEYSLGVLIFFINDSWFNNFFCSLLMRLTRIKAILLANPMIVVRHKKNEIITINFG